jgi:hypothetical protein
MLRMGASTGASGPAPTRPRIADKGADVEMNRLGLMIAVLVLGSAAAATAQSKVEASILGGWTMADGVTGGPVTVADGNAYDVVALDDSPTWGASLGVNVTNNIEVGFLFLQQLSGMELRGTKITDVGDVSISSYHPYIALNLGDADASLRPYGFLGLGATHYGPVQFTRATGETGETDGATQFSGTLGVGVKYFRSPRFGLRAGIQWTPTYIKSDASGWWCDPYWGCYLLTDAQYSNQLHLTGGITFRF